MKYDIVALYVCIDDFSKIYEEWENKKMIGGKRDRRRKGKLSMGEQLLIVILYHLEGFKNFKYYYKYAVEIKYKNLFKQVPCYDRFIQIMPNYQCHLAYYYSAYLVRQEEFTFWMQPRYQSAIAGEKKYEKQSY